MVRDEPIKLHNTRQKVSAVFARCLHQSKRRWLSTTFGTPSGDFRRVFRYCREWHSYNAKISRPRFLCSGGWQVCECKIIIMKYSQVLFGTDFLFLTSRLQKSSIHIRLKGLISITKVSCHIADQGYVKENSRHEKTCI